MATTNQQIAMNFFNRLMKQGEQRGNERFYNQSYDKAFGIMRYGMRRAREALKNNADRSAVEDIILETINNARSLDGRVDRKAIIDAIGNFQNEANILMERVDRKPDAMDFQESAAIVKNAMDQTMNQMAEIKTNGGDLMNMMALYENNLANILAGTLSDGRQLDPNAIKSIVGIYEPRYKRFIQDAESKVGSKIFSIFKDVPGYESIANSKLTPNQKLEALRESEREYQMANYIAELAESNGYKVPSGNQVGYIISQLDNLESPYQHKGFILDLLERPENNIKPGDTSPVPGIDTEEDLQFMEDISKALEEDSTDEDATNVPESVKGFVTKERPYITLPGDIAPRFPGIDSQRPESKLRMPERGVDPGINIPSRDSIMDNTGRDSRPNSNIMSFIDRLIRSFNKKGSESDMDNTGRGSWSEPRSFTDRLIRPFNEKGFESDNAPQSKGIKTPKTKTYYLKGYEEGVKKSRQNKLRLNNTDEKPFNVNQNRFGGIVTTEGRSAIDKLKMQNEAKRWKGIDRRYK